MKNKSRLFALAGVTLLSASVLAACGGAKQASDKAAAASTYTYVYTSDPESLDYTLVNKSTTGDLVANFVDGLLENDEYGNLVPSLAEDWKVSKDGLTYTYTLREDAKWFTVDGEEYGQITAEDFVTGLKHAADNSSEALYLVQNSIVGLDEYVKGETKDFSTVGVKALDEKTVQYTLKQPESFWNSKLTMGIMFPVNAEFLESKGKDYGTPNPDSILYSGPYLLSALTAKSSLEYTKNPNYWDADNVHIDHVKFTYYDGSDPDSLIKGFKEGNYSNARVFPNSSTYDATKKEFGDYIRYGLQDATTYFGTFNFNRSAYEYTAKTTDKQKESTQKAIRNKDFRQALTFAFNKEAYASQNVGKDAAPNIVRNTLSPTDFVTIGEKNYGDVVQENIVKLGDEWKDVNFVDGQNGLYNVDKAKAEFAKAKTALEAEGVEFPIHLDLPVYQSSEIQVQMASSFKQTIEEAIGSDNVVIDLHPLDEDAYYKITYYTETPEQNDFDISTASGWGPDYQDPSTYLDIFKASSGEQLRVLGMVPGEELTKTVGLDKFEEMLKSAESETLDTVARYTKYAEAEAYLLDNAYFITSYSRGGTPGVSKLVPFSGSYGVTGIKGSVSFKRVKVQDEAVKTEDYLKAREAWFKAKAESNAKYQESLADHVE